MKISDGRKFYLIILILFTLIFRIIAVQFVPIGGADAIQLWDAARRIFFDLPFIWEHRTIRFPALFVVAIFQKIFSPHPIVYFIIPVFFSIVQTVFLYKISVKIKNEVFAFFTVILFQLFPEMIITNSHLRIAGFEVAFFLISLYVFFKIIDSSKPVYGLISLLTIFLYLLLASKESNIFFMPAFFFGLLLLIKTDKIKQVTVFCCLFVFLFAAEFFIYRYAFGFELGRIGIITAKHLDGGLLIPVNNFMHLFSRYSKPNMSRYWFIAIMLFIISGSFLLYKVKNIKLKFVIISGFLFIIFITFGIKSINPITTVLNFRERYFAVITPLIIITVLYFFIFTASAVCGGNKCRRLNIFLMTNKLCLPVTTSLVVLIIFSAVYPRFYINKYYTKNGYSNISFVDYHPYRLSFRYYRDLNDAFYKGIPIITKSDFDWMGFKKTSDKILELKSEGLSIEEASSELDIPVDFAETAVKKGKLRPAAISLFKRFFLDYNMCEDKQMLLSGKAKSLIIHDVKYFYFKNAVYPYDEYFNSDDNFVMLISYNPFYCVRIKIGDLKN